MCQFHALRDASKTAFEADKAAKTAMRKRLQPKVREVRKQIKKALMTASPQEAEPPCGNGSSLLPLWSSYTMSFS